MCLCRALLLGLLALWAMASPGEAHRLTQSSGGGVMIPSLFHGQMEVISRHYEDILRLAQMHRPASDDFRRIENYAIIQKAWCGWGVMPGAITDENSPFNECSHAYLAAARELLGELRADPAASAEVTRLADTVDQEMLLAGAVVCGYSGESFDTADHITPHWSLMLRHWPTLLTLAAAIVVVAGVATLIVLA